jgi:hypothetical protein
MTEHWSLLASRGFVYTETIGRTSIFVTSRYDDDMGILQSAVAMRKWPSPAQGSWRFQASSLSSTRSWPERSRESLPSRSISAQQRRSRWAVCSSSSRWPASSPGETVRSKRFRAELDPVFPRSRERASSRLEGSPASGRAPARPLLLRPEDCQRNRRLFVGECWRQLPFSPVAGRAGSVPPSALGRWSGSRAPAGSPSTASPG